MKPLKLFILLAFFIFCMKDGYGQTYLLGDTQNKSGWFKLGRLILTQQGECTIHFRTSNNDANNNGFYGSGRFLNTGRTKLVYNLRVVQINVTTWDFYANLPSFTGAGAVLNLVSTGSWTPGLTAAAMPTNVVFADFTEEAFTNSPAYFADNVGIGMTTSTDKLAVNGRVRAKEVKVDNDNWPDYVFDDAYQMGSLTDLETFIKKNKHLPNIPSAAEVKNNGLELGQINAKLLQKIEELTLLLIEQNKRIEILETAIKPKN